MRRETRWIMPLILLAAATACSQALDPARATAMSLEQLAEHQRVDAQALAAKLGLPESADLTRQTGPLLAEHDLSLPDLQQAMQTVRAAEMADASANGDGAPPLTPGEEALEAEAASKPWMKIRIKFALWIAFFITAMLLLVFTKVRPLVRVLMLVAAVAIFGLWLGVEPNAPGTIKDGLMLYAEDGVVFMPRLIAFAGFMLMSIIGNKIFCGWGCQFGAAQDAIWQLPTKKWKPPFALTNTVRVVFFGAISAAAFGYGADILEPIDPFRIFRLGAVAAVIVAVGILVAGVWVYRPWCQFFCPFGLVAWFGERVAITKPRVNLKTCIDCLRCEQQCPNWSIKGIRRGHRAPQDCFACGTCIRVCPVDAIRWHITPPPDHRPRDDERHRPERGPASPERHSDSQNESEDDVA
jgi:NAD-dependent dihydropyrimidine dehydrogenase PreA subunit